MPESTTAIAEVALPFDSKSGGTDSVWSRACTNCAGGQQTCGTLFQQTPAELDALGVPGLGPPKLDLAAYSLAPLSLETSHPVVDINLFDGSRSNGNVSHYYNLCKDYSGLHVTTSCFTVWRKHKKTNGHAKVIPAVPVSDREEVCVFFFDDNLEWDGKEDSSGICSLRHAKTGEFIDFTEGKNGFRRDTAARHTVVFHSTHYRNVLVKANILDAMEDPAYFTKIIERFAWPSDKLIIFMDVNSTIVCNDTVQNKDLSNTLLSTMFEFVELKPSAAFDLSFEGHPQTRIDKPKTFKQLVKDITKDNREAYGSFWTADRCERFFVEVASKGEVRWAGDDRPFPLEAFQRLFQEYIVSLSNVINPDGIAHSWFQVFERVAAKGCHTVVLNSFGVDTRKVVVATIPDEQHIIHVTVNYHMWDDRDQQKFAGQFKQ